MDISALGGTAMAEQAMILDSVEISNEAMEKYMAERRAEQ